MQEKGYHKYHFQLQLGHWLG